MSVVDGIIRTGSFATGTTIVRGVRTTIREPSKATCQMIRRVPVLDLQRWQGDRVSVVFGHIIDEPLFTRARDRVYPGTVRDVRAVVIDRGLGNPLYLDVTNAHVLDADWSQTSRPERARVTYELRPDQLAIVQRRKGSTYHRRNSELWRDADLTLWLHDWPEGLEAARDAVLADRMPQAVEYAREVLSFAWPLFIDLTLKERNAIAQTELPMKLRSP